MVAGARCPECESAVDSEGGTDYECRECGHEFDAADLFLP
jgi:tRNA(Ile2) C34 agmatinyltransferase TiaS